LSNPESALRRDIAQSYLRAGRDEGAFAVLEAMLRSAPAYVPNRDLSWDGFRAAKGVWYCIEEAAGSGDSELRSKAARLAMEFVARALSAPDAAERFDTNDGLIEAHHAAKAIAAVMPDGAKDVLERMIASDALGEYERADAAKALEPIARGRNDAGDIGALSAALSGEERPEVVAAIAAALAGAGPAGRPAVEAALERAEPWTRMDLAWRIGGGTERQLADALTEAGVMDPITDEQLAEVIEKGFDIRGLIWMGGDRLVSFGVKSSTGIEHVALFSDLLKAARPAIDVDNLRESVNGVCTVSFSYQGRDFSFDARREGRWHDVPAVMKGFDDFMQAIGRDDRCYELEGGGEWGLFVVAPASKFEPLVARLGIPLERDSASARDAAKAYQRQIQNMRL
jgi:hypothetical protein